MNVGDRKGVQAEMNVVPLIDILLVLLVIFMVITPVTPVGLEARLPQPAQEEAPVPRERENPVVVQVAAGGRLRINHEDTNWERLGPRLEEIFARRAERVAFVQGDADVLFADVARSIGIMRGAGIRTIGLLTPTLSR